MKPPIDVDAQCGQTKGETIDERKNPQLERPGEETQVGETQQDERSDGRVVRGSEDCREDACYENRLFHFLILATGMPICSLYLATVRRARLKPSA